MDEEFRDQQLGDLIERYLEEQERYAELELENDVEPLIKISKESAK